MLIEELIELAKDMRQANERGEALGLSDDELAFYDALGTNDSAVKVMGDEALCKIARRAGRDRAQQRHHRLDAAGENVRAHLRRLVRRILRKYKYPPDKRDEAIQTVLEQAEVLSAVWAA